MTSQVAVVRTRPETVVEDYGRLMRLAKYDQTLPRDQDLVLKLNLSWTKYFPACSSQPWQVDGILTTLLSDGYDRRRIFPVENKTVVTNPVAGCRNNKWLPVLERHGLPFIPLPDVEWIVYPFKTPLLKLNAIFPEGIEIPKMYVGKNVLHAPTVKCVHPDTEILLADGRPVRAETLVKEWHVREPVHGDAHGDEFSDGEVRVVSLSSGGLGSARATKFWRAAVTDPHVWKVRTRTGRQVTTSARHPFLTPGGWKRADELRIGDRVAIARRVYIIGRPHRLPPVPRLGHDLIDVERISLRATTRFDIPAQRIILEDYLSGQSIYRIARRLKCRTVAVRSTLATYGVVVRGQRKWLSAPVYTSTEFWRWVGYFIAEGYGVEHHGSLQLALGNQDPEIREDWISLSRSLFGVSPTSKRLEMLFAAQHLKLFLETLGFSFPTNAATKFVPDLLFRCGDDEVAAFLQAYFDGDGTVGHDGIHATTKSERLARHVQLLFARLGIVSFLRVDRRDSAHRQQGVERTYFKVSVYGADVETFAKWIRFRCSHKQQRLDRLVARRLKGRPSHWDTIPIPTALFRNVREGLRVSPASTGRRSVIRDIEFRRGRATRPVVKYFVELFERLDVDGRFRDEIAQLRFLASDDIAWDRVEDVRAEPADVPFFYDLSVDDTECFVGNGIVLHNTHGHTTTTGAIKNAFGGLLKEVRHYAHEFIHEVMVDLMYMQRELHPSVFAVIDGAVMGDGAGPRTMVPRMGNLILASADQVAIDATAARIMGFDPLAIPYLRMCHERGLGVADPRDIEVVGDADAADLSFGFTTRKSLVIWGDQLIRRGPLRPLKRLLLHSPLVVWAPFASNVYHDLLWYPTIGRARIRAFAATGWGRLFARY